MAQNTAFALKPLKCDWGTFTKVSEEANLKVIEAFSPIVNEAASLLVSEACSWGPIARLILGTPQNLIFVLEEPYDTIFKCGGTKSVLILLLLIMLSNS